MRATMLKSNKRDHHNGNKLRSNKSGNFTEKHQSTYQPQDLQRLQSARDIDLTPSRSCPVQTGLSLWNQKYLLVTIRKTTTRPKTCAKLGLKEGRRKNVVLRLRLRLRRSASQHVRHHQKKGRGTWMHLPETCLGANVARRQQQQPPVRLLHKLRLNRVDSVPVKHYRLVIRIGNRCQTH